MCPEPSQWSEPPVDVGQSVDLEVVDLALALSGGRHEVTFAELAEVTADAGSSDVEVTRDVAGRQVALGQQFDDPAAGRVRQ